MMPARRPTALAVGTGTLTTLVMTGVLLGGSLGRGELLYRDFVTVPDPALTRRTLGLEGPAPRAVPLDAVTAILDPVVPAGVQLQLILVATLLLSGLGVTVLLRRHGPVATTVGAAVATWSPHAAERLLLGQPPTLLAVSVLPWLVLVAREARTRRGWLGGTALVALPAALTPVGGVLAGAAAVVAARAFRRASARELAGLGALVLAWCAPWLVVALTGRTDAGQAAGARAFAVQADGVAGVVDVLTGGGVWSAAAAPASRSGPVALLSSLAVLALAGVGVASLRRHQGLAVALALVPPLAVLALATPRGLAAFAGAQSVPGVALLRDTHRWLGVSATTVAVLGGLGAGALSAWLRRGAVAGRARGDVRPASRGLLGVPTAVVALSVSLAVLSVPDAAARLRAAYRPVSFPTAWPGVVAAVGDRHALVMPFQPLRAVAWAGRHPFLDPTALALRGPVTAARDLLVTRAGSTLVVGSSDPPEATSWRKGVVDPATLRALGIEVVVEWHGTPGVGVRPAPGLVEALRTPQLSVWEVTN